VFVSASEMTYIVSSGALNSTHSLVFVYVLFYLGQWSHFHSCFVAGVTNLNEPSSSLLLPPITAG